MSTATEQIGQHVEVRIRSDEYASDESVSLCWSSIDRLEDLVSQLRRWGVMVDGNTYTDLSGQFVIGNPGAFFEVIVATTGS